MERRGKKKNPPKIPWVGGTPLGQMLKRHPGLGRVEDGGPKGKKSNR